MRQPLAGHESARSLVAKPLQEARPPTQGERKANPKETAHPQQKRKKEDPDGSDT